MRVAPYSYDWLDNFGRQSPQELTVGLDQLEVGQSFMTIFELASFEENRDVTVTPKRPPGPFGKLLGGGTISYVIVPNDDHTSCRLVVKLALRCPPRIVSWPARWLLPWLDRVMMRRQLLSFKQLAERQGSQC